MCSYKFQQKKEATFHTIEGSFVVHLLIMLFDKEILQNYVIKHAQSQEPHTAMSGPKDSPPPLPSAVRGIATLQNALEAHRWPLTKCSDSFGTQLHSRRLFKTRNKDMLT